ncbi:hypothetical protein CH262_02945 [Rhodococcus sp. 05-2255-1e]|nr:hypothetical protein CH262_02945 [Rhodococcus sp. 05-2255-1e]
MYVKGTGRDASVDSETVQVVGLQYRVVEFSKTPVIATRAQWESPNRSRRRAAVEFPQDEAGQKHVEDDSVRDARPGSNAEGG